MSQYTRKMNGVNNVISFGLATQLIFSTTSSCFRSLTFPFNLTTPFAIVPCAIILLPMESTIPMLMGEVSVLCKFLPVLYQCKLQQRDM